MENKQTITVKVESLSFWELLGTLDSSLEKIQNLIKLHGGSASMNYHSTDDYGYTITVTRQETDKEFTERLDYETEELRDRKEFARLSKKFSQPR